MIAPHFTPIITGSTLAQNSLVLVTDTLVSRSIGATFSELTGQPTPLELRVPAPTTVALVTRTTEMLSSLVVLLEQTALVLDSIETASASLPATQGQIAQSSRSNDDGT